MSAIPKIISDTPADTRSPGQKGDPQTPLPTPERKDELMEMDVENTFPASDPVTPKHIT